VKRAIVILMVVAAAILWYQGDRQTRGASSRVVPPAAAIATEAAVGPGSSRTADTSSDDDTTSDNDATAEDKEAGLTFHGYACTQSCQGHEAGYNWAADHDITDPDDCPIDPHNSHSFTEGCWAEAGREGP
jgi:hypothetical protein